MFTACHRRLHCLTHGSLVTFDTVMCEHLIQCRLNSADYIPSCFGNGDAVADRSRELCITWAPIQEYVLLEWK